MTLASAFIAGRMALGALQFGFGSALSGLAALRNGFVMARTGILFNLAPIIGAIGRLAHRCLGAVFAARACVISKPLGRDHRVLPAHLGLDQG
jgi:hypothetical protein